MRAALPVRAEQPEAGDPARDGLESSVHAAHEVEGSLHVAHNSIDVAEGLLGGVSKVMVLPAAAYFGTKFLTRDHDRGDQLATSVGLGATAAATVAFGEGGIKHPAHGILARHKGLLDGRVYRGVEATGKFLGRAVPASVVAVGAGEAAIVVHEHDGDLGSLLHSQEGRTGVLHALGGALLMTARKPAELASILPLSLAVVNDLGALTSLDGAGEHAGLDSASEPHAHE